MTQVEDARNPGARGQQARPVLRLVRADESRRVASGAQSRICTIWAGTSAPYTRNDDGLWERPPNGVATMGHEVFTRLHSVEVRRQSIWIATPRSQGDWDFIAEQGTRPFSVGTEEIRFRFAVDASQRAMATLAQRFTGEFLWLDTHYQGLGPHDQELGPYDQEPEDWGPIEIGRAWTEGFLPYNAAFANVIAEEILRAWDAGLIPHIFLHDLYLGLVPSLLREQLDRTDLPLSLALFCHTTFADLPKWVRLGEEHLRQLVDSVLGSQFVGFQSNRDRDHFLEAAEAFGYLLSPDREYVIVDAGPPVGVGVVPAGINPIAVAAEARRETVDAAVAWLETQRPAGGHLIVGSPRLDPVKDLLLELAGFDELLAGNPDMVGKVRMVLYVQPVREGIRLYVNHAKRIHARVDAINQRWHDAYGGDAIVLAVGRGGEVRVNDVPIPAKTGRDLVLAMSSGDVVAVLGWDGMNLTVAEVVCAGEARGGSGPYLVGTEKAGIFFLLRHGADIVRDPTPKTIAAALRRGLTADSGLKARWHASNVETIDRHTVDAWFNKIVLSANEVIYVAVQSADTLSTPDAGDDAIAELDSVITPGKQEQQEQDQVEEAGSSLGL